MEKATIYKDRDNPFSVILKKNGINFTEDEMAALVKFEIRYKNAYYNSDDYPDSFEAVDATATLTIKPEAFDLSVSLMGDVVELIAYDELNYLNGLVCGQFRLFVKKDAELISL